ncbi:MAG: ferredoxin-NADP reductase [Candidatus Schekmanbacteria bacterium GWA2_38_11]|uniref:Ferredoxin-NADP reductase n=1 Tax=Candidatus Schekmanbacteria bacterium GWA2_38_11 TaxID=1817876 RepID=A0A1F7RAR0_9BACT|nr:MAG: ferredoxin-NADP reductase [Candidatus Schekmanbacteria bacterium GWA2_38_11]
MFEIVEKRVLSPVVNLFKVKAPLIAKKRKPGQFVIFDVDERGERVPLTIADADPEEGTVTIICQAIGKSTIKLNSLNKGDKILSFVGPLGVPSHIEKFGTTICIGGGVGIAVAYPLAKALKNEGNYVISIMGFRSKELLFMEEDLRATSDELHITTDDGTYARKGLVTDVLQEILADGRVIDFVLAVGPVPMMKAVCNITKKYKIKTMVSLNPIMVDGTGMCGACRVTIGGQTKFVCVDGPEFNGHMVDFDELMKRQSIYKEQERISIEKLQHEECCQTR